MSPGDGQDQPHFRFWVRRSADTWCLRFQVDEGRGLLRTARGGVLLDPPAARQGEETGLSAEEVRSSRFLMVGEQPHQRRGFFLGTLDDAWLLQIPSGRWTELGPALKGGVRLLLPLATHPETSSLRLPTEREESTDLVTDQSHGRWGKRGLKTVLGQPRERREPPPIVLNEHRGASSGDDLYDPAVYTGIDSEDDARALLGPSLLSSATMMDEDALGEQPSHASSPPSIPPPTERPTIGSLPAPPGQATAAPVAPRPGTLIRHIRRQQERSEAEVASLRARVAELEALLGQRSGDD